MVRIWSLGKRGSSQNASMTSWILRFRVIRAEEEVLGKLLGEGGAALGDAAFAQVHVNRTKKAAIVDAAVLVEAAVLHRDHRPRQVWRQLPQAVGRDRKSVV